MKKLSVFLLIVVLLTLTACGGGTPAAQTQAPDTSGKTSLEFWYALGGNNGKVVEALVQQFNESQSEIVVTATYQGSYAETMAKLWNALTAGGVPNVAQVGGGPLLRDTGAIVPITDFTDGADGIDRTKIYPVFWDYNSAAGAIWSMPFNQSLPVLYYNRDLFTAAGLDPDQPPQTWDELVEAAKKLTQDTDGNGEIDQWGVNTNENTHWYLSAMLLENGAQIVNDEQTEVLYNSPAAVEMLTRWGNFVQVDKIMPPNQHSEAEGDFKAGKLGMLLGSSASIPGMESEAPFKVGVAMLPALGDKRVAPVGGASLVIFKNENADLQNAAWKFVRFMTSPESSAYLTTNTGYLPIYMDALEAGTVADYVAQHPNRKPAIESLNSAVAIPEFAALGTSDTELRKAVQSIELNAGAAQELLDAAKQVVDRSIQESGNNP
jgi:sn-glycerol 3-phosphate transport system substrate-binding protein